MKQAPNPAPTPAQQAGWSRRAALGLVAAGGLAATEIGSAALAQAVGPQPLAPVLPATVSELASGLNLKSSAAWHLARRACPAPTAAIARQISQLGYTKWIDQQLNWSKIDDSVADGLIKKYLSFSTMTSSRLEAASGGEGWRAGKALSISRTIRHVFTNRHLYESMVDTMADQLYISGDGKAAALVGWFDWSVLRRHSLGKYSKLLRQAIRHPAMLVYLDNHVNSKDSPNENLGRELLELHTVGVGNYTEDDVRQSALLLTGHSFDWTKRVYSYHPAEHQTGPLTVMGVTYPNATAADGPATLDAYLNDLAHHPATATRIAERLAIRFVSDTPSAELIAKLAKVYLKKDTSLKAVVRALLLSDEFASSVGAKWRRPQETVATMVKLRRPQTIKPASTQSKELWSMTSMVQWLLYRESHQPRMWPLVDGYPDQSSDWMSAGAMLAHWYTANAQVNWSTDKEWPSKYSTWANALGVKPGQSITEVATKLTKGLTGYTWPAEHLELVIARLKDSTGSAVLSEGQIKNNLGRTLHFVFSSPYFKLR